MNNEIDKICENVWLQQSKALKTLSGGVNKQSLNACIKLISDCKGRVFTAGVGTSAAAARKIAHSLSCIEQSAMYLSPGDAVHGGLGAVQAGDVAILISKGGGTMEIVNLIPSLKKKEVAIIAVTEDTGSPLAEASDVVLNIKVEQEADDFNMLATTSTMAVIAVFDAVCISLMKITGFSKEQFLVIHPGGAVGEKLKNANA